MVRYLKKTPPAPQSSTAAASAGSPVAGPDKSEYYNFGLVNFYDGAKNKFHTHTTDQILFVINGEGYVASESEEVRITEGDTAFIPAGEKHWHGAADGHDFTQSPSQEPTASQPSTTSRVFRLFENQAGQPDNCSLSFDGRGLEPALSLPKE